MSSRASTLAASLVATSGLPGSSTPSRRPISRPLTRWLGAPGAVSTKARTTVSRCWSSGWEFCQSCTPWLTSSARSVTASPKQEPPISDANSTVLRAIVTAPPP